MTTHATLEFGALRVQFKPVSPEAVCHFTTPFASFLSGGPPDVILEVHRTPPPLPGTAPPSFDTGTTWCMVETNGQVFIYGCSYAEIRENKSNVGLVMKPDFSHGALHVHREEQVGHPGIENPLHYPLDQILTIQLLARGRGLLLHASGVLDEARGYCFAGASGMGKSTMARLWDGKATILNDDRLILQLQGEACWMYGTPWHGTYPATSPEACPLNEIFLLAHGPENRLRRLSPAEAAGRLLIASFPPFWDQEGMAWTLQLLDRLTASVPVYELVFRPDEAIVPFIRQAARGKLDDPPPA